MNRAQRRSLLQTKKRPKHNQASIKASGAQNGITEENAQSVLDNLPVPQLVAGINNLLRQLESRGVPVLDWDEKDRRLYKLQIIRGKTYYLVAGPEPEEPAKE